MNRQKEKIWVMPEWMEPYRELIINTGGNTIENLMNDKTTDFFSNHVKCGLIVAVNSQIALLKRLYDKKLI